MLPHYHNDSLLSIAIWEIARIAHRIEAYPDTCVYCGDDATCKDHLASRNSSGQHLHTVPACFRCNTILGDFPSISVNERCTYIASKECIKNRKLLMGRLPSDIDNYGYSLRVALTARQTRREILRARLANLRAGGIGSSTFCPLWGP
jgi:hypothetical protein